MPPE
ncbi:unnamed protein product, partial [Cuscuta epithymum]|jgi:hypothetical protein